MLLEELRVSKLDACLKLRGPVNGLEALRLFEIRSIRSCLLPTDVLSVLVMLSCLTLLMVDWLSPKLLGHLFSLLTLSLVP